MADIVTQIEITITTEIGGIDSTTIEDIARKRFNDAAEAVVEEALSFHDLEINVDVN